MKQLVTRHLVKRLLAASVGVILAVSATLSLHAADPVVSANIVGCVPDMTTYLLTSPLTTAQRQALHAKNFNQLPASQRALYLRAVTFDVGIMAVSGGPPLSSAALAECLKVGEAVFFVTPELLVHKAIVQTAMQELNLLIALQVSSNATFQQAMESGAVNSFEWWTDRH